jgi:mannose-1-phosphate guanylyltransferase
MDAIVLVGGLGTRLRPLTDTRHKSLVPVCNRPAIDYLFDWVRRSGIGRVVLALGVHNEDLAKTYPPGTYDGLEIAVVTEHARLESGGAIRNAVREAGVEGRFVVLNGDIFFDFDFQAALRAHESHRADLTLALCEVAEPWSFGVAAVDRQSMVTGFVEKPPPGTEPSNLVNAGAWIFEPGLVDEIPPGAVRVEETLFPSLVARQRRVFGFRYQGVWADIGTPARYLALNRRLIERKGANAIAASASVAPGAVVLGSSVGSGCTVASGARIEDSILWEGVSVGRGAVVVDSILADGVSVGAKARISGAVIGSGAAIGPSAVVPAGALIEPRARYDAGDDQKSG